MTAPLISVIIPVYNAQPYLCRCLDSVLTQTYSRLEIILVDDGSKDGSGDICDEYAKKDRRIKILHQENRGQSAARNAGLDIASGDYIGFVDADDWIFPGMYETLMDLLEQTGADIAQCGYVTDDSQLSASVSPLGEIRLFEGPEILKAAFREIVSWGLWDKLYKAKLWKSLRLPVGYVFEDNMVLMELFSGPLRLAATDKIGYFYDLSRPSTTRGEKRLIHMKSIRKLCRIWEEYIEEQNETAGNMDMMLCKNISCYTWLIRENAEISPAAVRKHNRFMHELFTRHYKAARKSESYRAEPPAKKLLWRIYSHSPALSNFLVRVYHEGIRP